MNPGCKGCCGQGLEKARDNSSTGLGKSQEQQGGYSGSTKKQQEMSPQKNDVIARLPGCDARAADAVSAYTQVKLEDVPRLLKIQESECPDVWLRLPRHTWPKSWQK